MEDIFFPANGVKCNFSRQNCQGTCDDVNDDGDDITNLEWIIQCQPAICKLVGSVCKLI